MFEHHPRTEADRIGHQAGKGPDDGVFVGVRRQGGAGRIQDRSFILRGHLISPRRPLPPPSVGKGPGSCDNYILIEISAIIVPWRFPETDRTREAIAIGKCARPARKRVCQTLLKKVSALTDTLWR